MQAYLDHHSASFCSVDTIEAVKDGLEKRFFAPCSSYTPAQDLVDDLQDAKTFIYDLVGADLEDKFYFYSSLKKAIQDVILSIYFEVTKKMGKTHFITTQTEDAAILLTLKKLEDLGCVVHLVKVDACGQMDLSDLEKKLSARTALVSLSWANPLTGVVQNMEAISKICKKHNVFLHVDASYVLGKFYLPYSDLDAQILTFSAEAFHGPKSAAGVFIKKESCVHSFFSMEENIEMAFLDVASFLGLCKASQQAVLMIDFLTTQVAKLRNRFEKYILDHLQNARLFYSKGERLPHVSCIFFDKIHYENLLYRLNKKKIYATAGGGKFQHLSNILRVCEVGEKKLFCALSFALSRYTTTEEIDYAARTLCEEVKNLEKLTEDM